MAKQQKPAPLRRSARVPVQFVPFQSGSKTPNTVVKRKVNPTTKWRGVSQPIKKSTASKSTKKGLNKVSAGKVSKKQPLKKSSKAKKEKGPPKSKNARLTTRPQIEQLEVNPILYGKDKLSNADTPLGAVRLALRYIATENVNELKKLVADQKRFPSTGLHWPYSGLDMHSAELMSFLSGNKKIIDAVANGIKEVNKSADKRPAFGGDSLLTKMTTGTMNRHMLGHRTARIEMTRGGRQGNNALIMFDSPKDMGNDYKDVLFHENLTYDILAHAKEMHLLEGIESDVYRIVRTGNRKLAAAVIQGHAKYCFNDLHINTLKNDKTPLPKFMPISTTKKGLGNKNITPVHTAATNPNVEHLKKIAAVEPVINQPDQDNWFTIHYAAVCEGPEPLKFLLSRGISIAFYNKKKESPLHCAARAGRLQNVEVLLKAMREEHAANLADANKEDMEADEDMDDSEPPRKRPAKGKAPVGFAATYLNAKNNIGETPLHLAAKHGRHEVARLLLKQPEVIADPFTAASVDKLTPLMMAARNGDLEMVRLLIDLGEAWIDNGDKFKRTPLTNAVVAGQMHIVAELLRRGASVSTKPDSSGNYAAHYAAAYGWLPILKMLEDADPACVGCVNSWHLSPLSVAFLKNHMDIVAYLLEGEHSPDVNISVDDTDNEGNTLLMLVLKHEDVVGEDKDLVEKVQYLINKGADLSKKNALGETALTYFAAKPVKLRPENNAFVDRDALKKVQRTRLTKKEYLALVDLLTKKNGEIAAAENESGKTAFDLAIQQGNFLLADVLFDLTSKSLVERWVKKVESATEPQFNVLHELINGVKKIIDNISAFDFSIFEWSMNFLGFVEKVRDLAEVTDLNFEGEETDLWSTWNKQFGPNGRTPLLHLFRLIKTFRIPATTLDNARFVAEFTKIVKNLITLSKQFFDFDYKLVLIREKSVGSQQSNQNGRNGGFPFSAINNITYNRNMGNANVDDSAKPVTPYMPSAFELTFRFYLKQCVENCEFNGKKFSHTNQLLKMMVETLIENDVEVFKKAMLEQDERLGFKGYSAVLFCIKQNLIDTLKVLLTTCDKLGILKAVCDLVLEKVSPDGGNTYETVNKSALLLATEERQLDVVEFLLAKTNLAQRLDEFGRNALHYLAKTTDNIVPYFELMTASGVRFLSDKWKRRPLHYIVSALQGMNSADICTDNLEYILNADPEAPNLSDEDGRFPIHYAFVSIKESNMPEFAFANIRRYDPIAVVSLLSKAMDPAKVFQKDVLGNSIIHYAAMAGANICLLTMLNKKADVNDTNTDNNSPLGYAVANKHEATTMTLIQAGGDVTAAFYAEKPKSVDPNTELWRWRPTKSAPVTCKPVTIVSLIVRNGWQGIIFVVLDKLSEQTHVVTEMCAAAVEHSQLNLSHTLLKRLKNLPRVVEREAVIFEKFAQHRSWTETEFKVFEALFSQKISWWRLKDGVCPTAMNFAERGDLVGLMHLKDCDERFNDGANWKKLLESENAKQVMPLLLKHWKGNLGRDLVIRSMKLIEEFANNIKDFATVRLPFDQLAYDGMEKPMRIKDVPAKVMQTPLVYAVSRRKYGLMAFLLSVLKVNVNAGDEQGRTPLMHALMLNDDVAIRVLARMPNTKAVEAEIQLEELQDAQNGIDGDFPHTSESEQSDDESQMDGSAGADDPSATEQSDEEVSAPALKFRRNFLNKKMPTAKENGNSKKKPKKESYKISFRNSEIDVGVLDKHGKNTLHYLVEPNAYENTKLAKALIEADPKFVNLITKKDNFGDSPLVLAADLRQKFMYKELVSHLRKGQYDASLASRLELESFKSDNRYKSLKCLFDFEAESKAFIQKQVVQAQTTESEEQRCKRLRKPFHLCQQAETSEIVEDEEGRLFSVVMNKTEVQYGLCGFHNYYRLQLVQRKHANLFVLFTHWGRIGDEVGQFQHTPFSERAAAEKEFKSIFRQKSGNEWGTDFENREGKYRLVEEDEQQIATSELHIELRSNVPKESADAEYEVVKDISNVDLMLQKWKMLCRNNRSQLPFGFVKREKVVAAREILNELRAIEREFSRANETKMSVEAGLRRRQMQCELTNEFYMTLALGSHAFGALNVIEHDHVIDELDKTIEQLLDFEFAATLMTAAANQTQLDPYRYIGQCLETKLTLLEPNSEEAQSILQYIHNSTPNVQVTGIFSVLSKVGVDQFEAHGLKLPNHKYLWHGTKPENLLSILKHGLLTVPPHAVVTGNLFGEGIYLADAFCKSLGYCTSSAHGHGYALLCQVALGEVKSANNEYEFQHHPNKKDLAKKHTLKALGRTAPNDKFEVTTEAGIRMPLGTLTDHKVKEHGYHQVEFNEYIVKDRRNVLINYLVQFKH